MDDNKDYGPILTRIIVSKQEEVARLHASTTLDALRRAAEAASPARDFARAVQREDGAMALIAEVKRASPSKGLIREDFDPVAIAEAYASGGASALSVLTDGPFFQGSLDIFRAVRASVDLPMLRKDFMIDPWQIYEARAAGADAILLITSILEPEQLRSFQALAHELGMAALVETHSDADIRKVFEAIRPVLLGVNNRDLQHAQFCTELEHTIRMLPLIRDLSAPGPTPAVVSESGIRSNEDVVWLSREGVSAVLVGESLMRQADLDLAVRQLMGGASSTKSG